MVCDQTPRELRRLTQSSRACCSNIIRRELSRTCGTPELRTNCQNDVELVYPKKVITTSLLRSGRQTKSWVIESTIRIVRYLRAWSSCGRHLGRCRVARRTRNCVTVCYSGVVRCSLRELRIHEPKSPFVFHQGPHQPISPEPGRPGCLGGRGRPVRAAP
jgi:hypothetical protein